MTAIETIGTKEWADKNVNCYFGCPYNCPYCYAKRMWKRFKEKRKYPMKKWEEFYPNLKAINKKYKKIEGRIMFPSTHDIIDWDYICRYEDGTTEKRNIKEDCFIVLKKILEVGNEVLITSKPSYKVITELIKKFTIYINQIQFRFTITTGDSYIAKENEPYAPCIEERFMSLIYSFEHGYKTSVSIEPFLDKDPIILIKHLAKYCTESIWLGIMSGRKYKYHDINNLRLIYTNLKNLPETIKNKIRLKDSIVNILKIRSNKIY